MSKFTELVKSVSGIAFVVGCGWLMGSNPFVASADVKPTPKHGSVFDTALRAPEGYWELIKTSPESVIVASLMHNGVKVIYASTMPEDMYVQSTCGIVRFQSGEEKERGGGFHVRPYGSLQPATLVICDYSGFYKKDPLMVVKHEAAHAVQYCNAKTNGINDRALSLGFTPDEQAVAFVNHNYIGLTNQEVRDLEIEAQTIALSVSNETLFNMIWTYCYSE